MYPLNSISTSNILFCRVTSGPSVKYARANKTQSASSHSEETEVRQDPGILPQRLYPKSVENGGLCPRVFGPFMAGARSGSPKIGPKCPQSRSELKKSRKIEKIIKMRKKSLK